MREFLEELKRQTRPPSSFEGAHWEFQFVEVNSDDLLKRLTARGFISPLILAERMLAGLEIESEARSLKLTPAQTYALYASAVARLTSDERTYMENYLREPKGKGLLAPEHPAIDVAGIPKA